MDDEARTPTDIIRDLLERLREREWVSHYERCPRGCCGDWSTICESCGADEGASDKPDTYQKHRADCVLAAAIAEAEAFMRAEEQLAEDQEAAANRPTFWEHIAHVV